jgi:hypothetical protein
MLGALNFRLPRLDHSQVVPLHFTLVGAAGQPLARNQVDLLVIPAAARAPRTQEPVSAVIRAGVPWTLADAIPDVPTAGAGGGSGLPGVIPGDPRDFDRALLDAPPASALEQRVRGLGYRTTQRITPAIGLAVTDYPTPALLQWVRAGGDLLFLARGPSPFFWVQGRGGPYSGSWMTSYSWLRPDIHQRMRVVNPLSMPYMNVMPHGTILGLPVTDPAVQGDFLAGMVVGWVRQPSVHTVQFRYGAGRVIMTTLAIEDAVSYDPVAVALFHDLVEYLRSDACRPTLRANY